MSLRDGYCRVKLHYAQLNHLDWELAFKGTSMVATYPLIPGMEGAGVVVDTRGDATWLGRRVAVPYAAPCGSCPYCLAGEDELCQQRMLPGVTVPGTIAEYIDLPCPTLVGLPEEVSLEAAAGFQGTLVVAWHAVVTQGQVRPGDRVLVTGATGTLGAAVAAVAQLHGATVTAVARNVERLRMLSEWVPDLTTVAAQGPDWAERIRETAGAGGVSLAVDLVGGPTLERCLAVVGPGGRVVSLGALAGTVAKVGVLGLFQRQITIRGSRRFRTAERASVLGLLAQGRLHLAPARVFPLGDAVAALDSIGSRTFTGRIVVAMDPSRGTNSQTREGKPPPAPAAR